MDNVKAVHILHRSCDFCELGKKGSTKELPWCGRVYAYRFQAANIRVLRQAPADIRVFNHFINKSKRMGGG
jgi:hypothetical protein